MTQTLLLKTKKEGLLISKRAPIKENNLEDTR